MNVVPSGCGRRMVRAKGLEPPHLAILGPKPGASTNSATPARTLQGARPIARMGGGASRGSARNRERRPRVHAFEGEQILADPPPRPSERYPPSPRPGAADPAGPATAPPEVQPTDARYRRPRAVDAGHRAADDADLPGRLTMASKPPPRAAAAARRARAAARARSGRRISCASRRAGRGDDRFEVGRPRRRNNASARRRAGSGRACRRPPRRPRGRLRHNSSLSRCSKSNWKPLAPRNGRGCSDERPEIDRPAAHPEQAFEHRRDFGRGHVRAELGHLAVGAAALADEVFAARQAG